MPQATEPLYFVIDEKNNSIELTDKGLDMITGNSDDSQFFVLPDITAQLLLWRTRVLPLRRSKSKKTS